MDASGAITREEYLRGITQVPEVMEMLEDLGLDHEADLFDQLDADGNGVLTFREFFEGATMVMRGQAPAQAKDVAATYLRVASLARSSVKQQQQLKEQQTILAEVQA